MNSEKGKVSIKTANIFPIIKKWLYSDRDIFLREIVSNACDAISKMKRLVSLNEASEDNEDYKVVVSISKKNKTLTVLDNGIGMTAQEIKKYINQIAFSGAQDFLEKYKDKTDEEQIIGHFGLGFYSVFMVSKKVAIDTLSYKKGAEAVKWSSEDGMDFEMSESLKDKRGTSITLYLDNDSKDYFENTKVHEILNKYCNFLPYDIIFVDEDKEVTEEAKPINEKNPLWLKNPTECTDEEYKEFYRKVFHDFNEPLFWIHLNMDFPFKLKGILYFPKLNHQYETLEGQIKLYCNQVFVADNIKEVIPEFLLLLKGVIDCPELPLNVSRSFLQSDGYVNKISTHIIKKVADKLNGLFKKDRDAYCKYWDDINPFVKYGCLKEEKFYKKVAKSIVYKTIGGGYITIEEYKLVNKDHNPDTVYYASDVVLQGQYIKNFKTSGIEAIILDGQIDNHFISFLEYNDKETKFARIDSHISESMKDDQNHMTKFSEDDSIAIKEIFTKVADSEMLKIEIQGLKNTETPAIILLSEESRRMQEMSKMYGGMFGEGAMPTDETLIVNSSSDLIKTLLVLNSEDGRGDDVEMIARHIYDLAIMSHKPMNPDLMSAFIERSNKILAIVAKKKI